DRLRLIAVSAGGLAREIGLQPLHPLFRRLFAVMGDQRGEERDVVLMLAAAYADLALPLGIGQFLIGDGVLLHAVLGGVDHASARRQAEPVALGVTILRGNGVVDDFVFDRLG